MDSLPISFWGWWTAGIVLLGIGGLAWLTIGVYTERSERIQPPEQVWDDNLREGNSFPPQWWFYGIFGVLIFSSIYIVLYPGFGDNMGLLNWSQTKQLDEGLAYYRKRTEAVHQQWQEASWDELQGDGSAMASAQRLFANNCAACHGEDARGQAGLFPDLYDDEWQWGGGKADIVNSITKGRIAVMPAWEGALSEREIEAVTDYVFALQTGTGEAAGTEMVAGRKVFVAQCVACHGVMAEGSVALGAPRLKDHRWLYFMESGESDLRSTIEDSIRYGRGGVMPAQENRLTVAQIRLLTAWLTRERGE